MVHSSLHIWRATRSGRCKLKLPLMKSDWCWWIDYMWIANSFLWFYISRNPYGYRWNHTNPCTNLRHSNFVKNVEARRIARCMARFVRTFTLLRISHILLLSHIIYICEYALISRMLVHVQYATQIYNRCMSNLLFSIFSPENHTFVFVFHFAVKQFLKCS